MHHPKSWPQIPSVQLEVPHKQHKHTETWHPLIISSHPRSRSAPRNFSCATTGCRVISFSPADALLGKLPTPFSENVLLHLAARSFRQLVIPIFAHEPHPSWRILNVYTYQQAFEGAITELQDKIVPVGSCQCTLSVGLPPS